MYHGVLLLLLRGRVCGTCTSSSEMTMFCGVFGLSGVVVDVVFVED